MSAKMIICPLDGRRFKTRSALAQHKREVHSGAPVRVLSAPKTRTAARVKVASTKTRSRMLNSATAERNTSAGSDLIASVALLSGTEAGKILFSRSLGPSFMGKTRLAAESSLWGRWVPRNLRVRVVCSGSMTCFGSVTLGWSPDSTYRVSPGKGAELIKVSALRPSLSVRLNETATLNIPSETTRKWYLCNAEPDDSCHGSLVIITGSEIGGFTGRVSVQIYLDWAVQFSGVEVSVYSDLETDISPDPGWEGSCFTTSDGSWDAQRLTLKLHSGGDMIPYSRAELDVIYRPSVTLGYVREDKQVGTVEYMAAIRDYKSRGMALFTSLNDAKSYIITGDVSKVLPYTSAGTATSGTVVARFHTRVVTLEDPPYKPVRVSTEPTLLRVEETVKAILDRLNRLEIRMERADSISVLEVDDLEPDLSGDLKEEDLEPPDQL